MKRLLLALVAVMLMATAAIGGEEEPTLYGVSVSGGNSYTADGGVAWMLMSWTTIFDYDDVMPHHAPEPLRFKTEVTAGMATVPEKRGTVAANILAMYFLEGWRTGWMVPYVEAGTGLIYTDFRRKGQGLRLNFNPVAGIGMVFPPNTDGGKYFAALRLHHVSNGGLDDDNTGINSALLTFGFIY